MQPEHNSKCLQYVSKPPSCFLEKEGCSRPRQPAPTNRYLYKVHWWIYSLSLTTEISSNLSQMPSAILDITPALTPQTPSSLSADVSFTSTPPPSVDDDVRADQCHLFLDLKASYACRQFTGRVEGPSSHREQLPLKEREGEGALRPLLSALLPPSLLFPSPPSSGLDLTQQQLVIWLCETSQAISAGQIVYSLAPVFSPASLS